MIFLSFKILREINFEDSSCAKSAILTLLEAQFLHFLKTKIDQINKIHSPKNGQNSSFCTFRIHKIVKTGLEMAKEVRAFLTTFRVGQCGNLRDFLTPKIG